MSCLARLVLTDGRLNDRQRISAATITNVEMNKKSGFFREQADERHVSDLACAFAAHENASALGPVGTSPRHQPIRGTAP